MMAFTLIELIVVVAILGILAILLLTNAQNFSKKGMAAKSMSNLRGITQALQTYTMENNGYFPFKRKYGGFYGSTDLWRILIGDGYLEDPVRQLNDPLDRRPWPTNDPDVYKNRCSYAVNDLLTGGRYGPQAPSNARQGVLKLQQVTADHSKVVVFLETENAGVAGSGNSALIGRGVGPMHFNSARRDLPAQRYDGGAHFSFLDGSVRWIETSKAPPVYTREFSEATFNPIRIEE